MNLFVGIDPGEKGGMAVLSGRDLTVTPMPLTERALWAWFLALRDRQEQVTAVLEQVGGYVSGDKGVSGMGPSMFTFGMSYGRLRMCLVAAAVPFVTVTPQKWQRDLGTTKYPDETKADFKRRLAERARELFPGVKLTLATADAVLIARYGQRVHPRGI
jgi:hypothetical protein